ncbi:hypothetical protein [Candidatus Nitrosocosmicus sp. FF01]|uniref:hypothetical protein n=1 Tax=Candidatus Nitrosocosmicus sp. FF01 TaxID=3397670 RepID=UPI0039EB9E42
MDTADTEYQEGITNNSITAMLRYQNSNAFVQIAHKLFSDMTIYHDDNSTLTLHNNFTHLFDLLDSAIQKYFILNNSTHLLLIYP